MLNAERVEITAFIHATEDEEKVERAIRNIIPLQTKNVRFKKQSLSGHFRDPITLIKASVKHREAGKVIHSIIDGLSSNDLQKFISELENRIDEGGNLYLRIDKQRAFQGRIILDHTDSIRIKFRFRYPHKCDEVDHARSILLKITNDDAIVNRGSET